MPKEFTTDGLTGFGETPTREEAATAPERIGLGRDPRTVRRAEKRRQVRLTRQSRAAEQIDRLPEPGEDIALILTGRWHGWDIVEAILDLAGDGVTIERMHIATLGFNNTQAKHLGTLLDQNRIRSLTMLVSEMFRDQNAGEYDYLHEVLHSRGHRLAANRNHTKLMLMRLSDGRPILTHGSLNLRRCNSFEQMIVSQDETLFGFFERFIEDALSGKIEV